MVFRTILPTLTRAAVLGADALEVVCPTVTKGLVRVARRHLAGELCALVEITPHGEFRFWNFEGFLQDSWKLRRDLTLEAGLRVAKLPNNEELTGLAMRFEPSASNVRYNPCKP